MKTTWAMYSRSMAWAFW